MYLVSNIYRSVYMSEHPVVFWRQVPWAEGGGVLEGVLPLFDPSLRSSAIEQKVISCG